MRIARTAWLLIACALTLCASLELGRAQPSPLAETIDGVLERPAARRCFWGVQIIDLDAGVELYSRNEDKLFLPASNAKLFTTALALSTLGPEYRFRTAVVSATEPAPEGELPGDLIVVGGGDPNLSSRVIPYDAKKTFSANRLAPMEELARQIVASGVQKITGDVVGDSRRYVWQGYADGWSVADTTWDYGAPVSALSFNDNLIEVRVTPGAAAGRPARLTVTPEIPYYRVRNETATAATRTVAKMLSVERTPGARELLFWGQISARSPGRTFSIAVDDPALFAAEALRYALEKLGVTVQGQARSRHLHPKELPSLTRGPAAGEPLEGKTVLAALESASLPEGVSVINKVSQNLHAEMLLREVGYRQRGVGSAEAGIAEMRTFLNRAGLKPWEYYLTDASGLSRKSLVTPQATVKLLRFMWSSPLRNVYVESLAVGGEDGTLDWRFSRTAAKGRIRAKTGTLSHITALSGYATTEEGRDLAFSILVNNFGVPASYIRRIVDEIVVAMTQTPVPAAAEPSASSTAR